MLHRYVENDDRLAAIDTLTNTVTATILIGQAPLCAQRAFRPRCRLPRRVIAVDDDAAATPERNRGSRSWSMSAWP